MNSLPARQKRKEPDEYVVDLFSHVCLSPVKKLRQDMSLPTIYEERPISVVSAADQSLDDAVLIAQSTELPTAVPELLPHLPEDERAIVLYKPVNPPLFPGGPVKSDDLPIRVHSTFFSQRHGFMDASGSLSTSWNHGNLPLFSAEMELKENFLLGESGQAGRSSDDKLAVVPWLPPQASLSQIGLVGSSSQEAALWPSQATDGVTDSDQMPIEDEGGLAAMEEDNVPQISTISNNGPVPSHDADEPWQHFCVPLPSYAPVMQSH